MRGFIFGDLEHWTSAAIFAETSIAVVRWTGIIVAGFVLAFGVWQVREQRDRVRRPKARFGAQPEKELEFLKRQAFRRMQTGGLAALVGFSMLVGLHVPAQDAPGWWAAAWLAVLFFSGWAALLALVDATSTWLHYSSDGGKAEAEKILLEYQMKKMREKAERLRDERVASEKKESENKDE
ncbi:MAG: hypothetical protein IJE77_05625 [Thermoguttaceae bacterium]|nr:hypothetical protein [Thermoguttaceae bacterium]MBQ9799662.1 hypothetical protein [Thermoguttaceae bacterium]